MWIHLVTPGVVDSGITLIAVTSGLWAASEVIEKSPLLGALTSLAAVIALFIRIWQTDREVKQLHRVERSTTELGAEAEDLRAKRAKVIADVQQYGSIVGDLRETLAVVEAAHARDKEVIDALKAERNIDRAEIAHVRAEIAAMKEQLGGDGAGQG